jgi:hypothetical protein
LLWLHHALESLNADLIRQYGVGAAIVFRRGPYLPALLDVASATQSTVVHFGRRYEPATKVGTRVGGQNLALACGGVPSRLMQQVKMLRGVKGAGLLKGQVAECCAQAADRATEVGLAEAGLRVVSHNALLLREPWEVQLDMAKWSGHFGTLTPFDRCDMWLAL